MRAAALAAVLALAGCATPDARTALIVAECQGHGPAYLRGACVTGTRPAP